MLFVRLTRTTVAIALAATCGALSSAQASAQQPPAGNDTPKRPPQIRKLGPPPPTAPAPVEKLGPNLFKIGNIRVDTQRNELSVDGTVNQVTTLEFIANTLGGIKSYESALELETNALNFNVALLLIGLDKANAVLPTRSLDPTPPRGDPVEIWVEWMEGTTRRRVPAEQLVFNAASKQTLPAGGWVYTGSMFNAKANALLADLDGALIGFVHSPSLLIDHTAPLVGSYGANRLNPSLGLKPGTKAVLIVRAVRKP